MKRPLIIAITGSIASGKSELVKSLQEAGFKVYSTDKIGHHVLMSEEVKLALVGKFGNSILDSETNKISRQKLSSLVFANPKNLAFLNSISHPLIFQEMQSLITNCLDKHIIFEVPLLFEAGLDQHFDYIITVSASPENQLVRLMKRNNLTEDEAKKKIASQLSNELKEKKADFVIHNNSDLAELKAQCALLISKLATITPKNIISF